MAAKTFPIPPDDEEEEIEPGPGEDEEEEEEEEEENDEEEEEKTLAVVPPPRQAKPRARRRRTPRESPPPREGPDAEKAAWPRELELLWPTILYWLPRKGRQPGDVWIQVIDLRGGEHAAQKTPMEPKITGDMVLGDETVPPGEAIKWYVIDHFHSRKHGIGTYQVRFFFAVGGPAGPEDIKYSESFTLEDNSVINMRRQSMQTARSASPSPGMGSVPGRVPPTYQPAPYGAPYPTAAPAYPHFYPPPPPQPMMGVDPYTRQLMETIVNQHRETAQQLNEANRKIAELSGQPAPPPIQVPPPAAAPAAPPQPSPLEQKLDRLLDAFAGVVSKPVAAGVGAATTAAPGATDTIEGELRGLTVGLMKGLVKRVAGELHGAMQSTGTVEDAETPAAPAEIVPPKDPKEDLPFQEVKLEGKWGNGQNVVYTPSKDGSGIMGVHPMGFLTENPFVVEKFTEAISSGVGRMSDALADAMSRMVAGGGTHVVNRTPSGAVNAGVGRVPACEVCRRSPCVCPPSPPSGGWPQP